jgi:hypothetical protein
MTEPDLTREQLAELSIALARVIFDVDDPGRDRLDRVRGRLRPASRGLVGRPRIPRGTAVGEADEGEAA